MLTLPEPASRDRVIPATHTPWDRRQRVRAFWVTLSSDNQQASVTCLCFVLWLCRVGSREPSSSLEPGGASRSLSDSLRPQTNPSPAGRGGSPQLAAVLPLGPPPGPSPCPLLLSQPIGRESHQHHCSPLLSLAGVSSREPLPLLSAAAVCCLLAHSRHGTCGWAPLGQTWGFETPSPPTAHPSSTGLQVEGPGIQGSSFGAKRAELSHGLHVAIPPAHGMPWALCSLHAWRASFAETTLRPARGSTPLLRTHRLGLDVVWGQAEIGTRAAGSVVVLHTAEDQSSSPHDLRFARPRLGCLGPTHLLSRQHLCNSVHSTNLPHAHAHSACTQRVWRAREAPGGVLCAQADRRQAVAAVQPTLGGDHSRTTWPSRPRPPRPGLALPLKHQHCSSALSWLCPLVSSKTVSPHMVAGAPQQSTAL